MRQRNVSHLTLPTKHGLSRKVTCSTFDQNIGMRELESLCGVSGEEYKPFQNNNVGFATNDSAKCCLAFWIFCEADFTYTHLGLNLSVPAGIIDTYIE